MEPTARLALRSVCRLKTPDEKLNLAFMAAKDNIARTIRRYTLGWGMSNAPHWYTTVVGRDTGWMGVGIDYVAPGFTPEFLEIFRKTQMPNGKIIEYICMETGKWDDYGLNIADNTPLFAWAVNHHWQMHADQGFKDRYSVCAKTMAEFMRSEVEAGERGLASAVPKGIMCEGICSWRNIIEGYVLGGEVTETNSEFAFALRQMADFIGDPSYAEVADRLAGNIRNHNWTGDGFILTRYEGVENRQVTGDMVFPVMFDVADTEQKAKVLNLLSKDEFWSPAGMTTIKRGEAEYDPDNGYGLLGGSWPNLTLWYAYSQARSGNGDEALRALGTVSDPVVGDERFTNTNLFEFPEWINPETLVNKGMKLSPWVPPTFVWAVLEGLLGFEWHEGRLSVNPVWPEGWDRIDVSDIPQGTDGCRWIDVSLERGREPSIAYKDQPSWAGQLVPKR